MAETPPEGVDIDIAGAVPTRARERTAHGHRVVVGTKADRYLSDYETSLGDPWEAEWILRCTGLRRGEAVLLRWADFDGARLTVRETKGDTSARRIPVAPPLLAAMRGWARGDYIIDAPIRERAAARAESHPESGHLVRGHADRDFREAWATTGVRPEVWQGRPAHCARRTWTTLLPELGADKEAVEYLIGHQPAGTGSRYYSDHERRLWPAMVAALALVPGLRVVRIAL